MAELVSILIPAYNERFFAQALQSAIAQRYPDFEVVVCDDSPGTAIERAAAEANSPRLRYHRNPARLGFAGNFTRCFEEARADLVKFLNDDDRLRADCVAALAGVMQANRGVTLATSRRNVIDAAGAAMAPTASTAPVSHVPALMRGRDLADLMLANALNVIGEPTTVMFRKSQVTLEGGALFQWAGKSYHCLADVSLWLRLLQDGFAYYHAESLSDYRVHPGQEQKRDQMPLDTLDEWLAVMRQARASGFLSTGSAWSQAMRSLRGRVLADGPPGRYEPVTRARLEGVLREVDRELQAAGA